MGFPSDGLINHNPVHESTSEFRANRCVREGFRQFDSLFGCFGNIKNNAGVLNDPSSCTSISQLREFSVNVCDENSAIDEVTTEPTFIITQSPVFVEGTGTNTESASGADNLAVIAASSGCFLFIVVILIALLVRTRQESEKKNVFLMTGEDIQIIDPTAVEGFKSGDLPRGAYISQTEDKLEEEQPNVEIVQSTLDEVIVQKPDNYNDEEDDLSELSLMEDFM